MKQAPGTEVASRAPFSFAGFEMLLCAVVIAVTVLGAEPAKLPLRMTAEVFDQDETGTWVLARFENTGREPLRIVPPVYRFASGHLWGAGESARHAATSP